MQHSSHKIIIAVIVTVALIGGIAFFLLTSPLKNSPPPPVATLPPAGPITVQGMIVCLPHINTEGPQTLECAFGFKDEAGRYYELRDADPNYANISSAPMDKLVQISGTFTPEASTRYQSIGIIEISSLILADTAGPRDF